MAVSRIEVEVGCANALIWEWVREYGWKRPAKGTAPKNPDIPVHEYHRRYLEEIGVPVPPKVIAAPKDTFDIRLKTAEADAREGALSQPALPSACAYCRARQSGLAVSVIAKRVGRSPGHIRSLLREAGVDLKAPRHQRLYGHKPGYTSKADRRARGGDWQRRT